MVALVQTDAELSEILMRAFILRRVELISGLGDAVPIGSASPRPLLISSTRRKMKARIRISLSSASVWTSATISVAIQHHDLAVLARARSKQGAATRDHVDFAAELTGAVDRDQRLLAVGNADDLDGPGDDDEERHDPIARLTSTSPAWIGRRCPCAATRASCAAVSVGNTWSARAPIGSGRDGLSGMPHLTHGRFEEQQEGT